MAQSLGEHLLGNDKTLPPLSPNFQATQLLTPRQLERITIDQPHYRGHLMESLATTRPPLKNAIQKRTGKMGDNYFFLQKELPVEQPYSKTALQLSEVRPWDQIVERPLKSSNMVNKEVHLPFPQEHPYTSHISRFAMFPDTYGQTHNRQHDDKLSIDAQTQTGNGTPNPPSLYHVSQKAGEWGQRVECRYLSKTHEVDVDSGAGKLFWDLPRSQRHKRAYTYPAPSLQYSRPPTTPGYLPLPSTIHSPPDSHAPVSPTTHGALSSIHKMLTRTTTYAEQYSSRGPSRGTQNVLRLEYSFRSRESHRPWTAESRGKYNRVAGTAPTDTNYQTLDNSQHSYGHPQLPLLNYYSETDNREDLPEAVTQDADSEQDDQQADQDKPNVTGEKVNASTQTEEEYFQDTDTMDQQTQRLPSLVSSTPMENFHYTGVQTEHRPVNALIPGNEHTHNFTRSYSANLTTPRTADSTRRLMGLYNGFNKTDILKRFHEDFPEKAPDLRAYSFREGKRHVIHGSHAYYFH